MAIMRSNGNKSSSRRFEPREQFLDALTEAQWKLPALSAHGVSPEIRQVAKKRNWRHRRHMSACDQGSYRGRKYAEQGYTIFLIGHAGHDEVIGTMGESEHGFVESEEEVERLDVLDGGKLAYLTQTTLSVDDANRIISKLRERYPEIVSPPKEDICYATQNRQEAVKVLSQDVDLVLVLGSQNSSNSQRLREIGVENEIPAYLIDGAQDINRGWFEGIERVLVTAGASAPETVVQDCVQYLVDHFAAEVDSVSLRRASAFPMPKLGSVKRCNFDELKLQGAVDVPRLHNVKCIVGDVRLR